MMSATDAPQTIFITAAAGHIGSCLVPLLLKDKSQPRLILPTSNAARLTRRYQGELDRVIVEEGSIEDPQWVESLLKKHQVTSVFLCLTRDNELFTTMNIFSSIKRAGSVKHMVYLSACGDYSLEAIQAGAFKVVHAAHVAIKFLLEAQLKYGLVPSKAEGGYTYTIIGPTLFFDNDLRSKHSIMKTSFFDEPLSPKGQSRVSPSDIALAVYRSLIHDQGRQYHGQKIMIGSKHAYTNAEIQDLWSKSLGKDIKVLDASNVQELDDFELQYRKKAGPAWARDLRLMYEIFAVRAFGMTEEDYKKQVEFLGKEPEDYAQFVRNTAAEWLAEEKAQS